MNKRLFSYLILDFERIEELTNLVTSINDLTKLSLSKYRVVCLANGGSDEYQNKVHQLYKDGFIDDLIIRRENTGGGAHEQLFHYCQEDYAIQLQSDHKLIHPITEDIINYFTSLLNNGYECVDLAGNQGNGNYSERANMVKTSFYKSLSPLPGGNPGPYFKHGEENNEGFIQKKFQENDWKIAHVSPLFFEDCGKWSIREHACGGVTKHRTDLKSLYIIKPLKQKYDYLDISDEDWELILTNKWVNGTIPKKWTNHSFNCFGD